MSKETELNALIKDLDDVEQRITACENGQGGDLKAIRADWEDAKSKYAAFKRDNMAQILKDRKAK